MILERPVDRATQQRSDEVIIVKTDGAALMELAMPLAAMGYNVVAIDSIDAMPSAERVLRRRPKVLVLALDGSEEVAKIEALMESAAVTKVLLLVPQTMTAAALTGIARTYRAAILGADEPTAIVVATLVALVADARVFSQATA